MMRDSHPRGAVDAARYIIRSLGRGASAGWPASADHRDDAGGEFALVTASSWIDRLHQAGHLGRNEYDAAMRLQELFEASGVRPRLVGGCYDGAQLLGDSSYDGGLLEVLNASEMAAWRKLGRLLAMVPDPCRAIVTTVVLWDMEPWDIRALQRGLSVLAGRVAV